MNLYHDLLALLLTLQIPPAPSPSGELLRLGTIAQAMAAEAELAPGPVTPRTLASHTLALWYEESRLAESVHRGEAAPGGSDRGAARCFGQIHNTGLLEAGEWLALGGTDLGSTRNCARVTMRILQRFARWCRYDGSVTSMARVHAAYGTGLGCVTGERWVNRARFAQKLRDRL